MGEKAPSNKCWAYPQSQVVAGLGVGRPGRNVEAQAVATGAAQPGRTLLLLCILKEASVGSG